MGMLDSLIALFGGGANAELLRVRKVPFAHTARGRAELESNRDGLDARLRALLKLVDGLRDGADLLQATDALGTDELSLIKLYAWGYIASSREDDNQILESLIARMDGLEQPAAPQREESGKIVSFKVFDAKRLAEEAERLDFSVRRRKKAAVQQQRRRVETEGLNAFGIQMLTDLAAKGIVVEELESESPNLVNRLALAFGHPTEFLLMLDGLILDERGGRQGFSVPVMRDLDNLKMAFIAYYAPAEERGALLNAKPPALTRTSIAAAEIGQRLYLIVR